MTEVKNLNQLQLTFKDNFNKRADEYAQASPYQQAQIRSKCATGLWQKLMADIKMTNPEWRDIKDKTGNVVLDKKCWNDGLAYNKAFRCLLFDHAGDLYNLSEVGATIQKRAHKKSFKIAQLSAHRMLLRVIFAKDIHTLAEYDAEYKQLETKMTDTHVDTSGAPVVSDTSGAVVETESVAAPEFTQCLWAPTEQDKVIVAMSLLPWEYEYDGGTYENPAPFRGTDYKLAIGKAHGVYNNWKDGDSVAYYPNRIWLDCNNRDVYVSIPKHKCSGHGCNYITDMKASDQLAVIIRPWLCKQIGAQSPFLFNQTRTSEPMNEANINVVIKKFVKAACSSAEQNVEGCRAMRSMYAHFVKDNVTAGRALPTAASMRHSLSIQQGIYAKKTAFPTWAEVVAIWEGC